MTPPAGDMSSQYRPPEFRISMGLRSMRAVRAVFCGTLGDDFAPAMEVLLRPWHTHHGL
jgi:hypothetical protein